MKKGFTLIELLAVIVILSVIALIATPMILNVIEESKKQALEASVKGIIESANYFALTNDGVYEFKFDENNKGVTPSGDSLNYTGSVDAEGKLILDREGNISLCLMNDNYYVYKNYNSGVVVGNRSEDSCNIGYDVLTNKYIAFLESVGSSSNVYSKDEVDSLIANVNISITNNTNEITNIKSSIETLQNDLSNYALKSELQETNTNLENLSSMITNNTNSINNLSNEVESIKNNSSLTAKEFIGTYTTDGDYPIDISKYKYLVVSLGAASVYSELEIIPTDLLNIDGLSWFTIIAGNPASNYYAISNYGISTQTFYVRKLSSPQGNVQISLVGYY